MIPHLGRGLASTDSSLILGFSILNRIATHPTRVTVLFKILPILLTQTQPHKRAKSNT